VHDSIVAPERGVHSEVSGTENSLQIPEVAGEGVPYQKDAPGRWIHSRIPLYFVLIETSCGCEVGLELVLHFVESPVQECPRESAVVSLCWSLFSCAVV